MALGDLCTVLSTFEKYLEHPEEFSECQDDKAEVFKSMTKTLYDSIQQTNDNEEIACKTLPALITENFDDEQVWQQLELQNAPVVTYFNKCLKGLNFNDTKFGVKAPDKQFHHNNITADDGDFSSEESVGYDFDGSDSEDSESKISHDYSRSRNQEERKESQKVNSTSGFDDRFFKVTELEEFLRYEDLKAEKGQPGSESDESDIDLFADIPSDDEATDDDEIGDSDGNGNDGEEEDEPVQKRKCSKEIMYKDFFDPPEEAVNKTTADSRISFTEDKFEGSKESSKDPAGKKRTVRFSQNVENDGKLQLLDDSADDEEALNKNLKSDQSSSKTAFEKQQEKERKRIKELEESLLRKKPWQFTGEVASDDRPKDSLLRQQAEFESNLKQDFVATDEITEKVESIIKMAIINKAWCDVEVKVKPVEDAKTYKPIEPLDQTKSKESLAEVYANQFQKQYEKEEEKEDARHVEIRKLMNSVALTLSELFCHTPRPPVPEIKVINNMPAITVEEVAPVAVSDATLLAPEEIKPKSGLLIGKSERTETDKKRERRKKKRLQKIRSLEKEEKQKIKASTSKKEASKFAKQQALKKISQQKNVTIIHEKKRLGKR